MNLVQNFTIKNSLRLDKFLAFKETNLQRTEFRNEPVLDKNDGTYKISIRSSVNDLVSLETLLESWKREDKNSNSINSNIFVSLLNRLRA